MSYEGIHHLGPKETEIEIIHEIKFPENNHETKMLEGYEIPATYDNYEDAIASIMEDVEGDIDSRTERLFSLINSLKIAFANRGSKTFNTNTHDKGIKEHLKGLILRGGPITISFSDLEYITIILSEITNKVVVVTNSPEVSEFFSRSIFDRIAPITAEATAKYKELMN